MMCFELLIISINIYTKTRSTFKKVAILLNRISTVAQDMDLDFYPDITAGLRKM